MKKRIIITEEQLRFLIENDEYLLDEFHEDVKQFVKDLLSSPSNAKIPERLEKQGINRNKLIDALIKKGFLTRKQTVKEVENGEGKRVSRMLTVYSANMDNGSKKIDEVHKSLFESKDNEELMDEESLFEIEMDDVEECVAAGASNGAGGTWMGDASYTVPFPAKKNDPTTKHDHLVRRSTYKPKTKSKND